MFYQVGLDFSSSWKTFFLFFISFSAMQQKEKIMKWKMSSEWQKKILVLLMSCKTTLHRGSKVTTTSSQHDVIVFLVIRLPSIILLGCHWHVQGAAFAWTIILFQLTHLLIFLFSFPFSSDGHWLRLGCIER